MARLSRITTRSGDQGTTHLAKGDVVTKTCQRIECLGDQDELLAALGMLISRLQEDGGTDEQLAAVRHVQQKLFDFGAELSLPDHTGTGDRSDRIGISEEDVTWLETEINRLNQALPPLKEFVLPGPPESTARAHVCRTVCRRFERACFRLNEEEALNPAALRWINRLSDWLFVLGRSLARGSGETEHQWQGTGANRGE